MKTEHKYAQVLRWIADGESIQVKTNRGVFVDLDESQVQGTLRNIGGGLCVEPEDFRLKPRTITVNGREIVAGEREALQPAESYFVADPTAYEYFVSYCWSAHPVNLDHLARGLVHLTKENAIAHAKAMLDID